MKSDGMLALVAVATVAATGHAHSAATAPGIVGRSEGDRPLQAFAVGDANAPVSVLVVGCVHGDEPAGVAIARRLLRLRPVPGVALWVVPSLNPDGVRAGTRGNADGVDLNRNFPWRWRRHGGVFDSGPAPLSEPESRFAYRLVLRIRPRITIWFHQHLRVVDRSGGDERVERRYARLVGLPLARLARHPGSAVGWENHRLPGTTSFVVELPAGKLSARAADRYARAVIELARGRYAQAR